MLIWGRNIDIEAPNLQQLADCVGLLTVGGQLAQESAAPEEGGFVSDAALFEQLLRAVQRPPIEREAALRPIVERQVGGMCGPYDFGEHVNEDLPAFRACEFGVKAPASALDSGVALFVKALPLLGLHTVYSCDGHGQEYPHVLFHGPFHHAWAQQHLPVLFPDAPFQFIVEDKGWMSHRLEYKKLGPEAWWDLVAIARKIIDDPDGCAQIRNAK